MKQLILSLLLCISGTIVQGQLLKDKFFNWTTTRPPILDTLVIDTTYSLYIRSICRTEYNDNQAPVRVTVVKSDCQETSDTTVLIERQYLYYSAANHTAIFIMLLPNYPRHENGPPTYNMPEIRDARVVNLWNANCFLFGKVDARMDTISFRRWNNAGWDKWVIKMDEKDRSIRIEGALELTPGKKPIYRTVSANLSLSVTYHLAPTRYPMNVDGTMFNEACQNCRLQQVFYYEARKKAAYRLHIPYSSCSPRELAGNVTLYFEGKKGRSSRIPFDPQDLFD